VLQAFKDVEDNIGALRHLAVQAAAQDRAVTASREALRLSLSQYRGGMTTYLQVVTNQTLVLSNERGAIDIQAQRQIAAVNLIKALGGGWSTEVMRQEARGESE
jgi:outer membrane protein TolC